MAITFVKENISLPVIGIPYYNRPDLLARCLLSIEAEVDDLVVIHNGPRSARPRVGPRRKNIRRVTVIDNQGCNTGVAAAWNFTIKNFPAAWWLLVNSDIQFRRGDLARMAAAACDQAGEAGVLFGNHGYSMFALTELGVARVGLFDENIWPAYLEDCDWSWRCQCAGIRQVNVPGIRCRHGHRQLTGSCTILSDGELRRQNHITHGNNFAYYRRKWGGDNGQETFRTPFNNPALPISCWPYHPQFRRFQFQSRAKPHEDHQPDAHDAPPKLAASHRKLPGRHGGGPRRKLPMAAHSLRG